MSRNRITEFSFFRVYQTASLLTQMTLPYEDKKNCCSCKIIAFLRSKEVNQLIQNRQTLPHFLSSSQLCDSLNSCQGKTSNLKVKRSNIFSQCEWWVSMLCCYCIILLFCVNLLSCFCIWLGKHKSEFFLCSIRFESQFRLYEVERKVRVIT